MKAHPTHLYALLYNERRFDQLAAALEQTRAKMEADDELPLWQYWEGMRLAGQGKFADARGITSVLSGEHRVALERTIAMERARQGGDWAGLVSHFENEWNATKSPGALLALSEAKLNAGDPAFVVQHAKQLVQAVGTPEALRIATAAAARSGEWHICLGLLDSNAELFPQAQLPADLRRLRIACEQNLGMLSEAVRDAEALVSHEKNIANLMLLFDLNVRAGRLPEAAKFAHGIVEDAAVPAAALIRVSWVMRLEDRLLSQAALQKAMEQGIDDPQHISMATVLAQQLELPEIASRLAPKFAQALQSPGSGITALDHAGLMEFLNRRAEHSKHVLGMFERGLLPVHMVGEQLRTPASLWPILSLAGRTFYAPGAVYFRHGGKQSDADVPNVRTLSTVYLDITSFVIAHELGLLPLVEKACGSLLVPPALRTSLVQQLDLLTRPASKPDEARKEALGLIDSGKIGKWDITKRTGPESEWRRDLPREWCDIIENAQETKGLVVDLWPKLRSDGSAWLPPSELQESLTHAGAVVASLEKQGVLSKEQATIAQELVASHSTGVASNQPAKGQRLFLTSSAAQLLGQAHLINHVVSSYEVVMSRDEIENLRAEEQNEADRIFAGSSVRKSLDYLAASSKYQQMVLSHAVSQAEIGGGHDAAQFCIAELLQAQPAKDSWMWIDDRWLNGHEHVANIPVISTAEIITELRRQELLSDADFYQTRHNLRVARFRFLPVLSDELIYFLSKAEAHDAGMLHETAELFALRVYWADSLAARVLQMPPVDKEVPNPKGEGEYFTGSVRAMHDTFVQLFNDSVANDDLIEARATWLLYWMWAPVEHFGHILGRAENEGFLRTQGSGDSLFAARMLDANAFTKPGAIGKYGAWLGDQFRAEPTRRRGLGKQIQRTLEHMAGAVQKKTVEDKAHTFVLNRWFFNLPEWLREEVQLSAKTRQRLRIRNASVATVGDHQFESEKFWRAAEAAFNGNPVSVASIKKAEFVLTIQHRPKVGPAVILQPKDKQERWGFEDPAIAVIDARISKRTALLTSHPEWFDLTAEALKTEVKQIASLPTVMERISAIDKYRARSMWLFYLRLTQKFSLKETVDVVDMEICDPAHCAKFLRLDSENQPAIDWEQAGRALLDSVGLEHSFTRMATLPRMLPNCIIEAWDGFAPAKRSTLLRHLIDTVRSPLVRAQLFRLSLRYNTGDSTALGEQLVGESGRADIEGLGEVARWTWNQLGDFADQLSPVVRLAIVWAHAGHIFEILRNVSESEQIASFFRDNREQVPGETIVRAQGEDDIAFPRHVPDNVLLINAVGSAIASEPQSDFKPSDTMRSDAAGMCVMPTEGDLPKLEWLFDPAAFTDLLGSYLGTGRENHLRPFTSERVASFISSGELARQLDSLLSSIETAPENGSAWIMLGSLLRGRACPPSLRIRMEAVMRNTRFESLPNEEPLRSGTILALSAQAAVLGGDSLVELWQERIAELAGWLRTLDADKSTKERRQQMVLRCALTLAHHGPIQRPVACLSQTLIRTWRAWPEMGSGMLGMLQLLLRLPHVQLADAWELVLTLRKGVPQMTGKNAS